MEKKKVGFASGIGFILAAAGSAVGLGNLWGFPYKTSQNGGAAFVLIYVACVLLIGFVTMLSEIYLGRRAQANPMTAYKMIHKNLGWCGLVAIMIPAFIICYYSVLGGWTTKYALNSFSGNAGIVGTFSVNTGEVILYTAIFLVLSMVIIMGGVKDGIEKASKVLMPVLFLILVAIAVYALTLGSGVREGLSFYLKPDFSGITFKSVLVAMGQAFYSLSLGMGIMITYGSYTGKEVNLVRSTAMICILTRSWRSSRVWRSSRRWRTLTPRCSAAARASRSCSSSCRRCSSPWAVWVRSCRSPFSSWSTSPPSPPSCR